MPEPHRACQLPLPAISMAISRPPAPRRPAVLLVRFAAPLTPASLRALLASTPRQLPLTPQRPRQRLPQAAPSPCLPCPRRASCRAPCASLSALLGPEELLVREEVSSPALMAGEGHDPAFMVEHAVLAALAEEEQAALLTRLSSRHGERLRAALAGLLPAQREVIEHLLAGHSRPEVARLRGVRRQSIHKDYHAALRALRRALEES